MRHTALALFLMTGGSIGLQAGYSPLAHARSAQRPNMDPARTAFYRMSNGDRLGLYLMLMATGHYNAMVFDTFGTRLYEAIASFQQSQGHGPTGIADPPTMALLNTKGGVILRSWGMHFVDHPFVQASLFVPSTFGLSSTPTRHGLAFENAKRSMSIDFAFFPESEASMANVFDRLTAALPNRRIDMKVMRDTFFAIAGGGENYGTYSRYIGIPGGTVGFTATWNTNLLPNGVRVAVVMANGLLPSRSLPDVAATEPQLRAAAPVAPPQQASLEAPRATAPATVTVTGSAFFVSTDGDLITNNHVVKGCASATITGRGSAHLVAKDAKNDLALVRLDSKPAGAVRTAAFRTAPMQLGEAVYVLGFPYAGALDNGVNFTNGMVSSVAGMDNDTTRFQMTAAVQPGNSGGPVLDGSGNLLGVTVARMNDIAALEVTHTVPQSVNFGIKGDIAASFLRVNGIEPRTSADAAPLPGTQIAAAGKAFTAQVMCERAGGGD